MNEKELLYRITVNPEIMVGKPTIRGLRITVDQILKAIAAGINTNELLEDYPELQKKLQESCLKKIHWRQLRYIAHWG